MSVAGEQVEQPLGACGRWSHLHEAWIGDVRVDQKHRAVDFQGDAHRQIERDEALALGRNRAGDHDEIGALGPRTGALARIPDDRTLDHAKLVGDLRTLRLRRDEPGRGQRLEVDLHHLAAPARFGTAGSWLRGARRCRRLPAAVAHRQRRRAGASIGRLRPFQRLREALRRRDCLGRRAWPAARAAACAAGTGTSIPAFCSCASRCAAFSMRSMGRSSGATRGSQEKESERRAVRRQQAADAPGKKQGGATPHHSASREWAGLLTMPSNGRCATSRSDASVMERRTHLTHQPAGGEPGQKRHGHDALRAAAAGSVRPGSA